MFVGVSDPLVVGRYHSLVVKDDGLPTEFHVTARPHGLIMGMCRPHLPLEECVDPKYRSDPDAAAGCRETRPRDRSSDAIEKAGVLSLRMDAVRAALQPTR